MNIRTYILELLAGLEQALPPPSKCHHIISRARYGSEESGWQEKFCVQVNHNGNFYQFFLDDADFDSTPQELVKILMDLHNKNMEEKEKAKLQLGVAAGQYVKDKTP